VPCICDDIPGELRGYAVGEDRHPMGKSSRHLHIYRRNTSLYRVEWGTDKQGQLFVNIEAGKKVDKRFIRAIERWVMLKSDELNVAYDRAVQGHSFAKVKWEN